MSDQDFVIPSWLDNSYLCSALRSKYNDTSIQVANFHVQAAAKKGEFFSSEMFRINAITSTGVQHRLILKKPHESKERAEAIEEYHFFGKEIQFFTEFLPEVNEILRSVDEWEELCPQLIYCDIERQVLILEDLQVKGYASGERENRIPREGVQILMRKLAKFHAAMMTLNQRKNGAFEKMDTLGSYFLQGPFHAFFKEYPYALVEEVKKWGSEFEGIAAKLEKIAGTVVQRFHDATISHRGLNVLAHNDLWYTNVMVKMDEEKNSAEDVLMIDFQLNRWASVTSDLLHIFFRCLKREDYEGGLDYQIEIYHSNLQRVLTKLKSSKVPTLEDILEEVHDNFFHGGNL